MAVEFSSDELSTLVGLTQSERSTIEFIEKKIPGFDATELLIILGRLRVKLREALKEQREKEQEKEAKKDGDSGGRSGATDGEGGSPTGGDGPSGSDSNEPGA